MFFDDRLATVLRHRADGKAAARTQFRQLLDLLGNRQHGHDDSLQAAAWLRLSALGELIPAKERAAIVSERGWHFRNPQLATHLADCEPDVASSALQRADLSEEDWVALIPRLPVRARGFVRLRDDLPEGANELLAQLGVQDRGLPVPEAAIAERAETFETPATPASPDAEETDPISAKKPVIDWPDTAEAIEQPETDQKDADTQQPPSEDKSANPFIAAKKAPPPASASKSARTSARTSTSENEKSEITALVERIAQFRKGRAPSPPPSESSPRLPLDEPANGRKKELISFSFVADTAGRIEWADQHVAAMLIGKRLIPPRQLGSGTSDDPMIRAFATHQPIDGATLSLDGSPAITGDWIVTAQPRFSRIGGRFHGYIGRMRRVVLMSDDGSISEADRVRQLLHELRTPVNALQGFAEIIQQQLFGPAPNEYRALAANIAGDAARILAGFDELERLARLESGALSLSEGACDLSAILGRMAAQLQTVLAPRMAGFSALELLPDELEVAVSRDDAEAMIWRVMATLAGSCAAAETLTLRAASKAQKATISWQLPEKLLEEASPFSAQINPTDEGGLSAGLFGAGFSLRLARAEARAAGGDLVVADDWVSLSLPLLTETLSHPSPENIREAEDDSHKG